MLPICNSATSLANPRGPNKAEIGKLYELQVTPLGVANFIQYYVFDVKGRQTNKTWTPGIKNFCLVLSHEPDDITIILVGEDIVRLHDSEELWKVELIPLVE